MFDLMPVLAISKTLAPIDAQCLVEMALPGLMRKRGHVHAVRDETHRIVFRPYLGPVIRTEARRHNAVNTAHAVHAARAVERQARHVEEARHVRRAAEIEEAIERQPELPNEIVEVRDAQ